jgi:hypothetical protein
MKKLYGIECLVKILLETKRPGLGLVLGLGLGLGLGFRVQGLGFRV